MSGRPQLWVFAGPNGAGKSTLAGRFVQGRVPIVNPDVIALSLPRRDDGSLNQLDAGRMALEQRAAFTRAGESFAFETTLSGASELRAMRAARNAGYKLNLVYVGVYSVVRSKTRVAERVSKGGHNVAEDALLRRFERSMKALDEAAVLADRVIVFDNSGDRHRLVLVDEGGVRWHTEPPQWLSGTRYGG